MDLFKEQHILSVSDLTHSIKNILEMQYRFVHIRGEISNLSTPYSGHTYFTLKDTDAQIKAVLFKGQNKFLQEKLKEGQQVVCHGRISVYMPRGEYQIIVDTLEADGSGFLHQQFALLKEKLNDEGLFSPLLKKDIPSFPQKIALITSPRGAAVHDFLKICKQRKFYGDILLLPTRVQGKTAAADIAQSLEIACSCKNIDVVVLLRGGGSLEDLWCFNEEKTVRAIHAASLPVVTGVGHETDTTLADLAADLRTHTPTAAAETLIPDTNKILQTIEKQRMIIERHMCELITKYEKDIHNCRRIIGDLDLYLGSFSLKIDHLVFKLQESLVKTINGKSNRLSLLTTRVQGASPDAHLVLLQERVFYFKTQLQQTLQIILNRKELALQKEVALLDSVSPLSILSRGYSIATTKEKKIISDARQVVSGQQIDVRLQKGHLTCEVLTPMED